MSDDLIERLRRWKDDEDGMFVDADGDWVLFREAATALAAAQAEIARLREALKPVADGPVKGEIMESWIRYRMREARAALSPQAQEATHG